MKVVNFKKNSLCLGRYQLRIQDENTYVVIDLDEVEVLKIAAMLKGNGF
jgi:hypothetical protein